MMWTLRTIRHPRQQLRCARPNRWYRLPVLENLMEEEPPRVLPESPHRKLEHSHLGALLAIEVVPRMFNRSIGKPPSDLLEGPTGMGPGQP